MAFQSFYLLSIFAEPKIKTGNVSISGVHRFFLAKSPFFKEMIEKDEEIKIENKYQQAAIEALRYLYKDQISQYKVFDHVNALVGGIKFELKGLKDLAEGCVEEIQLTDSTVCDMYQYYEDLNVNLGTTEGRGFYLYQNRHHLAM